jgi:hypothetical protein
MSSPRPEPTYQPEPAYYADPRPQAEPADWGASWRTAADDGWRAARNAEQAVRTQTRTGLPKRVPQAQLVPGGVDQASPAAAAQRSPEGVRGLLSAYHRGVQRGRGVDDGSANG